MFECKTKIDGNLFIRTYPEYECLICKDCCSPTCGERRKEAASNFIRDLISEGNLEVGDIVDVLVTQQQSLKVKTIEEFTCQSKQSIQVTLT